MVVHTDTVFGSGVLRMLSGLGDIEVIGCNPSNQYDLLRAFRLANPDIVLITTEKIDHSSIPSMLVAKKGEHRFRMIVMNERDNIAHIYEKGQMVVSTSVDLYTLLQVDE